MQDRYSLSEAQEVLGVSKATLEVWIRSQKAIKKALEKQRQPDDLRVRYLTRAQVEQLATTHRRQLVSRETPDPLTSNLNELYNDVTALKQGQSDLQARVTALEQQKQKAPRRATSSPEDDLPI